MADITFPIDGTNFTGELIPTSNNGSAAECYERWRIEAGLPSDSLAYIDGDDAMYVLNLGFTVGESSQSLVTFTTEGALHFYKSQTPVANQRSSSYNILANASLNQVGKDRVYFANPITPSISLVWGISGDMTSDSGLFQTNKLDTAIILTSCQQRGSHLTFRVQTAIRIKPSKIDIVVSYISGTKNGQVGIYTFEEQPVLNVNTLVGTTSNGGVGYDVLTAGTTSFTTVENLLHGFVKDGVSGEPIENALVRSHNPATGNIIATVSTDAAGGYAVAIPSDFQTYLVAMATGFPSKIKDFTEEQTEPYTFQMGVSDGQRPAFTTPVLVGMVNQPNVDGATSKTINRPAEVQEGDLLILFIGHRSDVTNSIISDGFELYHFEEDTTVAVPQQDTSIYTKIATANEPATYTVNVTSTGRIMLSIAAMRDCKIDNATYNSYEGSTPWVSTTPTPGEDKLQLLNVHWVNSNAVAKTPTFNPANSVSLPESSQNVTRNFIGSLNTQFDVIVDGLDADNRGRLSRLSFVGLPLVGFRAMIRGNVKKLGLPYGADIIGVSTLTPPTVVGTTTSNAETGDYELDVAPYQGQCNVMAVPNYGIQFIPDAVLPEGALVRPTTPNGYLYKVTVAGTSASTEPEWPTVENQLVVSGSVTMITEYMLRPLVNSLLTPVIEGDVPVEYLGWFTITGAANQVSVDNQTSVVEKTLTMPISGNLYITAGISQIGVFASLNDALLGQNRIALHTLKGQDVIEYAPFKFLSINEVDNTVYNFGLSDDGVTIVNSPSSVNIAAGDLRGLAYDSENSKLFILTIEGSTVNLYTADVNLSGGITNVTLARDLSAFMSNPSDTTSMRGVEYRKGVLFIADRISGNVHQIDSTTFLPIEGAPILDMGYAEFTPYKLKFDSDNLVIVGGYNTHSATYPVEFPEKP